MEKICELIEQEGRQCRNVLASNKKDSTKPYTSKIVNGEKPLAIQSVDIKNLFKKSDLKFESEKCSVLKNSAKSNVLDASNTNKPTLANLNNTQSVLNSVDDGYCKTQEIFYKSLIIDDDAFIGNLDFKSSNNHQASTPVFETSAQSLYSEKKTTNLTKSVSSIQQETALNLDQINKDLNSNKIQLDLNNNCLKNKQNIVLESKSLINQSYPLKNNAIDKDVDVISEKMSTFSEKMVFLFYHSYLIQNIYIFLLFN